MSNTVSIILKVAAALVVIAGAVFVAIAYGDKIAAWCKKLLGRIPGCKCGDVCEDDFDPEDDSFMVAGDGDFEG